jgi:hypothetical protein
LLRQSANHFCSVYVLTESVAFLEVEVTYWNLKPLLKKMFSVIYVPVKTQQFHNFLFFINFGYIYTITFYQKLAVNNGNIKSSI